MRGVRRSRGTTPRITARSPSRECRRGSRPRAWTPCSARTLRHLLHSFHARIPDELLEEEDRFYANEANLDAVHFAWAGPTTRGAQHYFRVQGPRVLFEYDNTQRGGNHVHSVWRDLVADFGLDVLYGHLDQFHRTA